VLPWSPRCADWLRYGVQPKHAGPELVPGHCDAKAHEREHLGLRRLIAERRMAFVRLGRHVRLNSDAIEAFIAAGRVEPVRVPGPRGGRY
jgi:hypothetical protein